MSMNIGMRRSAKCVVRHHHATTLSTFQNVAEKTGAVLNVNIFRTFINGL